MRNVILGVVVGLGLVAVVWAGVPGGDYAYAQRPQPAAGSDLIAMSMPLADGRQVLTVVDPQRRSMGVYHVDQQGNIALKSVRNVHWDLLVEEFNSAAPLPREIRSMVEQR